MPHQSNIPTYLTEITQRKLYLEEMRRKIFCLSLSSFITPSINILNSHGDITHPWRSPTLTLNHSPSSLHTLTQHSLLSYILCTAANNFPFIPYILSTRHIASLS